MNRCDWCGNDPLYVKYHDQEWGKPVHSDKKLFEFLILEGAQAGLSWITVLKKRPAYREAFDHFDFNIIASYKQNKIKQLLNNPGIIRNRLKIESTITNAQCFLKVRDDFGTFNKYIWSYVDNKPIQNHWQTMKQIPARTELSDEIAKNMKQRGFKFFGTTICYAFMQAVGMVNDHVVSCHRHKSLAKTR